jgi:hypothetical protein
MYESAQEFAAYLAQDMAATRKTAAAAGVQPE